MDFLDSGIDNYSLFIFDLIDTRVDKYNRLYFSL